jgi:hypothetical protein
MMVFLMFAPWVLADAPMLQAASDWNLPDTPLTVTLSISLQAHAPLDETRMAMLDRVHAPLSLNLYPADGESGVSVLMNGNELLTMAQKGDAEQFSCMPNVSSASLYGNALELLLGTSSNSIDLRAVNWYVLRNAMDDVWVMSNAILEPFSGVLRKRNERPDDHQGHGPGALLHGLHTCPSRSWRKCTRRFCPSAQEGDLHDLTVSLTILTARTNCVSIRTDGQNVPLRVEYNGVCGVDGKLRTVKLVWRTKRENGETRDESR